MRWLLCRHNAELVDPLCTLLSVRTLDLMAYRAALARRDALDLCCNMSLDDCIAARVARGRALDSMESIDVFITPDPNPFDLPGDMPMLSREPSPAPPAPTPDPAPAPLDPAPDRRDPSPAPPAPAVSSLIAQMALEANVSLSGPLDDRMRTFFKLHGICFYCRKGVHLRDSCPERPSSAKRPRSGLAHQLRLAVKQQRQQR